MAFFALTGSVRFPHSHLLMWGLNRINLCNDGFRKEGRRMGGEGAVSKNNFYLIGEISIDNIISFVPSKMLMVRMATGPQIQKSYPRRSFFSQLKSHPSEGRDNAQITLFGFVRFARRGECCQAPQDKLCWVLALVPVWRQKKNQEPWKEAGAAHGSFPLLTNDGCCAR